MATKLQMCYNKGCGKEFDPLTNENESCTFHPGVPVFHDALKGWSCCNKKSTDFSTFLSLPGCKKAPHSNVKPVEVEKPKEEPLKPNEVIVVAPLKPVEPMVRPNEDEELILLPSTIMPSLKTNLENVKRDTTNQTMNGASTEIAVGTSCKNSGCQSTYQNEGSNLETCTHHTGIPIFHEGMKYWSCCERKTSDFDNFLNQEGCTKSNHVWIKKQSESSEKINCRHDFHQTGGYAIVTVFSKNPIPQDCVVKANRVSLDINITYENGNKVFEQKFKLFGIIDLSNTQVVYYPTKVEIKMKKAEPISWKRLEFSG